MDKFWLVIGKKKKKVDMEFFIGYEISRNKILGRGKIFIRHGIFFFFFWEYFGISNL